MPFDTFDAVFFTAAFVVPGFIWSAVLSMLVARKSTAPPTRAVEFLTFSCVNYGLWSWLIYPLFHYQWWDQRPYATGAVLFLIAFISPVVLGLLSGWMKQRNAIAWFLGRFGFRTIHPIPTAWDYYFSRGQVAWVVVTMKDGGRLYGLFGLESFAGDDPDCRDLYIEAVYQPTEHGDWAPVEDTGGAWIAPNQIAALEFREVMEIEHGGQEAAESDPAT